MTTERQWADLPTTNARSAHELLEEIATLIEQQPLRYNQAEWLVNLKNPLEPGVDRIQCVPECGTVACIAGWITILTKPHSFARMSLSAIEEHAADVLGYLNRDWLYSQLFTGGAIMDQMAHEDLDFNVNYDPVPKPGTPKYAAIGARHIRRFMFNNKSYLQSMRITVEQPPEEVADGQA